MRTLPKKKRKPWSEVFPKAQPQALALLDSMLQFNPAKRCTMEEALSGEYLAPLHQDRKLPTPEEHFSFGFESPNVSQSQLRDLVWEVMTEFHPEIRDAKKGKGS